MTTLLVLSLIGQTLGVFLIGLFVGAQLQIKYGNKPRTKKSKKH